MRAVSVQAFATSSLLQLADFIGLEHKRCTPSDHNNCGMERRAPPSAGLLLSSLGVQRLHSKPMKSANRSNEEVAKAYKNTARALSGGVFEREASKLL